MNKLITLSVLFFTIFVSASYANKDVGSAVNKSPQKVLFAAADATTAIDSFNAQLLDPDRKLYYRDTDKPDKLGAIWTQATYWDMIVNAYKRTNDPKYLQLVEDIYQGGYREYDRYNWDNGDVWFIYDDIMWWIISLARAYELTNDQKYLNLSQSGFERVWSGSAVVGDVGSYDPVNSGMFWMFQFPDKPDNGKMSCINYPTVVAAMTLFNATNDTTYLDKAKEIYGWARQNLFDLSTGRVADSKHGDGAPDWTAHTYNQATCIGAAVMLYKETNEQYYLDDAVLAANFTKNTMCDSNGILPYETGEEQGVYNAIFAQYIIRLIEDCNKPEYLPWLTLNINTGWKNRDIQRGLTSSNYLMPYPESATLSCYNASSIPALLQVCPASDDSTTVPTPAPIQITDEAGLRAIANNLGGYYMLANDITLTADWTPIGRDGSPFYGVFDGNGKVIKNLKFNQPTADKVGFLGFAQTAVIKRLGLENVSVVGQNDVGALVGTVRSAVVDQCYVTGYVEGNDHVGGLVGGAQDGSGQSTLMNCYAYASVATRSTQVGGLLGITRDVTLKNSYFAGLVVSPSSNSGGIVSLTDGGSSNIVENSMSMAYNIKGSAAFRILANDGGRTSVTKLTNNYGFDQSLINGTPVPSTSSDLGPDLKHGANQTLQGLQDENFYKGMNWDLDSIWKVEAQAFPVFKNQQLPLDVDMIVEFPQSLTIPEGDTYQLATASIIPGKTVAYQTSDASKATVDANGLITAISGGDVTITATTETDAFSVGKTATCAVQVKTINSTITTPEDLANIRYRLNGTFTLANDIDLVGSLYQDWEPIYDFSGTLDGNGHIIKNFTINRPANNQVGFFGKAEGATIKKLGIENAKVIGGTSTRMGNDVGILVGCGIDIHIEECYVSASSVEGRDHVGLLVGKTQNKEGTQSVIKNSYATGTMKTYVNQGGGIVGLAESVLIENCYYSGVIDGVNNVGGIIALAEAGSVVVRNCAALSPHLKGGNPKRIVSVVGRNATLTLANNYARADMKNGVAALPWDAQDSNVAPNKDLGANVDFTETKTQAFYETTLTWNFDDTWKLFAKDGEGDSGIYPVLKWQTPKINTYIISMPIASKRIAVGEELKMEAYGSHGQHVYYKSADNAVLSADNNGVFKGMGRGVVNAIAYSKSTNYMNQAADSVSVTVYDPAYFADITTAEELNAVRNDLFGNYRLVADIDLSGYENFEPIGADGNNPFVGKLHGQGYEIKNLTISRSNSDRQGLFGYLKNAEIKGVELVNVNIIGRNDVGGLAGVSLGTSVEQVSVTGYVEGNDHVGGLFGATTSDATDSKTSITNAYINGHIVTRSSQVGGIAGVAKSTTMKNVYVAGKVESLALTSQGGNAAGIVSLNENNQVSAEAIAVVTDYIKGGTPNYFVCRNDNFQSASKLYARNDMPAFAYATGDHGKEGYLVNDNLLAPSVFLTQDFYETTMGWDFTNVWQMSSDSYPVFKAVMSGIKDIVSQKPEVIAYSSNGSIIITTKEMTNISVFDVMGRKVSSMKLNGTSSPLILKSGIYLIHAEGNGGAKDTIKLLHK